MPDATYIDTVCNRLRNNASLDRKDADELIRLIRRYGSEAKAKNAVIAMGKNNSSFYDSNNTDTDFLNYLRDIIGQRNINKEVKELTLNIPVDFKKAPARFELYARDTIDAKETLYNLSTYSRGGHRYIAGYRIY